MTDLRDVAARLVGPEPGRLALPCPRCAAPAGEQCRWTRAPGPPLRHYGRTDRTDGLVAAHRAVVDALAAWAAAQEAGQPVHALAIRARHVDRLLRLRAGNAGWPVRPLPDPSVVLAVCAGAAP